MAVILDADSFSQDTYKGYLQHQLFSATARALPDETFLIPPVSLDLSQLAPNMRSLPFPPAKGLWARQQTRKWLQTQGATTFISLNRTLSRELAIRQIFIVGEAAALGNAPSILTADAVGLVSSGLKALFDTQYPQWTAKSHALEGIIRPAAAVSADFDVKAKLTGDRDYFICTDFGLYQERLVTLLKAFSVFKKMLLSNWKLMVVFRAQGEVAQAAGTLSNYKFRQDVVLTDTAELEQKIQAAYALVSLSDNESFPIPVIEAFRLARPVISVKTRTLEQLFGDRVLYPENNGSQALGDLLMTLYKGETFRNNLIQKIKTAGPGPDLDQATTELVRLITR